MNSISNLTAQQLRQAAQLKDKIEALKKQLAAVVGGAGKVIKKTPAITFVRRKRSPVFKAKSLKPISKVPKFRPGKALKDAVN